MEMAIALIWGRIDRCGSSHQSFPGRVTLLKCPSPTKLPHHLPFSAFTGVTGVYLYCNNFWYVKEVSIFHFMVLIPGAYSPFLVPTIQYLKSPGPREERLKMELTALSR